MEKSSDLFASAFYGKAWESTEERISKDYLLYKIKIKLEKYVREISTNSQRGQNFKLISKGEAFAKKVPARGAVIFQGK